jgi:peptidoglycan/LPS O-acetylase OafA/YrhL
MSRNLDVLRAIAVIAVFIAHLSFNVFHREYIGPFSAHGLGKFGVLLFFVHTSLVLMFSLDRTRSPRPFLNFYLRRAFRIYPLSIFCVLAVVALRIPRMPDATFTWIGMRALAANLGLVQNLTASPDVIGPLWSLPFEVQMYIVLPFLYIAVQRWRSVRFVLMLCLAAIACQAFVFVPHGRWLFDLIRYIPCFLSGVLAYQVGRRATARIPGWIWPILLTFLVALHCILWRNRRESIVANLAGYLICMLIGFAAPWFRELPRSPVTAAAHKIATYSYGIYLFHAPIMWLAFFVLRGNAVLSWLTLSVLICVIPYLAFRYLEHPMIERGKELASSLDRRDLVRA